MAISGCLNFALLAAYVRSKRANTKQQADAARATKQRLLIYTVVTFGGHLLIAGNFVCFTQYRFSDFSIFLKIYIVIKSTLFNFADNRAHSLQSARLGPPLCLVSA
jgi:hypothetical protein